MERQDESNAAPWIENDPRLEIPETLRAAPRQPEANRSPDAGMWGVAKAWGTAFDFIFTIIAGAALGWGVDKWQGTAPKGMGIGLGIGFVVAFIRIVRGAITQDRVEEAKRRSGK